MGKSVKPFVLRMDVETMSAVEAWAEEEFRSVNGQLLWLVSEALKRRAMEKLQKKQ